MKRRFRSDYFLRREVVCLPEYAENGSPEEEKLRWAAFCRSGRIADYLSYRGCLPHTEGEADVRNRQGTRHP